MFLRTKTTGLIFFFLLCVCSPAFSLNYYWVNGSGVWSDLSHWNTMPDGSGSSHLNIPTSMDDVYFMNNGGVGYTVTMDAANTIVKCRNMDWSSAPAGCTLTGTGTRADIHGSMVLKSGMTFDFAGDIWFVIDMNVTNTITSNGVHFPQNVYFSGNTGSWNLAGDLYVEKSIYHFNGRLNTQNFTVTAGTGIPGSPNPFSGLILDLGSSTVNIITGSGFFIYLSGNFIAGTSTINHHTGGTIGGSGPTNPFYKIKLNTVSNTNPSIISQVSSTDSIVFNYYGTIHSWNHQNVAQNIRTVVFKDNGTITNANQFTNLKFEPGKTYTFGDYTPIYQVPNTSTDITILAGGTFTANGGGGCTGAITMMTNASGIPVNIINNSGATINTYNMLQQDIHGVGSNALINNNGNDLGNNTGWTFATPQAPYDLYWIGGPGEWTNPNHWSLTDGGASSGCIPNAITNVHFTNLSGFTATSGDVEEITTPVDYRNLTCRDLDFSGVTGYPTFKSVFNGTNTSILNIYGSSRFGVEMKQAFKSKIYFKGNGNHDIESNGIPFKSSLIFDGIGNWSLQDSFTMDTVVYPYPIFTKVNHINGTIRTMGNSMLLRGNPGWFGNLLEGQPNEWFCCRANRGAILWLGEPNGNSSNIYLEGGQYFWMEYEPGKFHAEKSNIYGIGIGGKSVSARNQPHDFYNVEFGENNYDCKFSGGIKGKLINNNVETVIETNSPNNRKIHYTEFKQLGIINDNQIFDTLILTGGFRYVLEKNKTQTITSNGALLSMGGCDSLVYIQSSDGTATAAIKKETGSNLVIDNTIVENIIADISTGATYTINNGLTLANSSGWTVINPTARTLYWVDNGGFWDESSHWSLSSGGIGGECPPTPLDNVFFDQNSFSTSSQTVQIRHFDAYCRDMNWTGVQFNPRFFANTYLIHFNIFGNYVLDPDMIHDLYAQPNFRADHPSLITMAGHQFHFDVHFKNPLGDWTFTDDFKNKSFYGGQADIYQYGTIRTNGNVNLYGSWRAFDSSKLHFNNSIITLFSNGISYPSRSIFYTLPINFNSGTSHFIIENGFGNTVYISGINVLDFYNVTVKSSGGFVENVGIKNKLLFEKYGAIYTNATPSDTIFVNDIEFKEGGLQRSGFGQLAYHKLTYAPGQSYEFSGKHFIIPKNGQEGQLNIAGSPNQYIQLRMWTQSGLPAEIIMNDINNTPTCTQYVFLSNMIHTGTEIIQVPTPGGNVINNTGWAFIPCNPCPNNPPVLDIQSSSTEGCEPRTVDLVLLDLLPGEKAVWFRDSLLTDTLYNSANLFQPFVNSDTCFWAKVFNEGGQCYSSDTIRICIHVNSNVVALCKDITVELVDSGGSQATLMASMIDDGSYPECNNVLINYSVFPDIVTCAAISSPQVVTLTVTSQYSSSTCTAMVSAFETQSPIIICPFDFSVTCDIFNPNNLPAPTVIYENCPPTTYITEFLNYPANCVLDTFWVKYTVSDQSANTSQCFTEIIVTSPFDISDIHWPANVNREACSDISVAALGTPVVTTPPSSCVNISIDHLDVPFVQPGGCVQSFIRKWTVTESCSNQSFYRDQYIYLDDNIPPVFVGFSDTIITITDTCFAFVTFPTSTAYDCTMITESNNSPYADNNNSLDISGYYPEGVHEVLLSGLDACGNLNIDTIVITVRVEPTVIAPDVLFCHGEVTGQIDFITGNPATTVLWTNNNTNIGLGAGGTGAIPSFTAQNLSNTPMIAILNITPVIFNTTNTCYGESVQMQITVNPIIAPIITIAETSGSTPNDGTICAGANATLTANGDGTYLWSSGATSSSITTSTPGTYLVTVTSAGCAGTAAQTITVNPLPVPMILITETSGVANNDGILCSGSTAMLSASGAGTYEWSTGASTASITTGTAGMYTVTATLAGCSASVTSSIAVNPLPDASIVITDGAGIISDNGIICAGLPATLSTQAGGMYMWSTGQTTSDINTMISGTYTVTVTSLGCRSTESVILEFNALPCGWYECNIGSGCEGDWTYDIPSEEFTGTSTNCYYVNPYNHDELSFAARNLCGNGSITVEVKSITGNLAWAGITMRETNADNSKKIQLMTNLSLLSRREARYATGGTSYFQQFPSQNRYWLRLVRTGNQFAGYVSPEGSYWYFVMAADINMSACLKVGMVVTNYNPISTSTAVFGNVVLTDSGNNRPVATDDISLEQEKGGWIDATVRPNPTTGHVTIQLASNTEQELALKVMDILGRTVNKGTIDVGRSSYDVWINDQSGIYIIELTDKQGNSSQTKVIKID